MGRGWRSNVQGSWSRPVKLPIWEPLGCGPWNCLGNKLMRYPQQLGRSWMVFGYLPRNCLEPHQPSALEPSGTSSAICPETFRNLISFLLSAPEPSGTSSAIFRNFISRLHRNPPEPQQLFAPQPSGTLSAICGTLSNLITFLLSAP